MPRATLRLATPHATALMGALSPEVGREIPRTRVELSRDDGDIVLNVEASDLGALRAALNSYLRWIEISEQISNMVGEQDE
ncbi:MAG TPA: KEOPS complex subunit Pcc1 [Methanomassiliicoccaceae archaeon]|jgi:KEOPS complex subunit Pcc1|nr:KEOPS complex subunit Pcc1 [Methanomassiliicoccaceae archaeon]HOK28494.1 KEOPS complex subunit Pcc1 [Methanomassiliicoccaceae archaeon]HOL07276.1 KEOPS complex subunit Pcc1 [Methanomassiliicoccaceae archaeon]HPP44394.1 KEOPS complex subunit Pcc1 [Methanomassiliicoccaceae archaeon]HQA20415.1 KEOPS complex subunit Pcc1 [Methanomassiliicoccaceae archaeon]